MVTHKRFCHLNGSLILLYIMDTHKCTAFLNTVYRRHECLLPADPLADPVSDQ